MSELVYKKEMPEPKIRDAKVEDLSNIYEIERASFDNPYTPEYIEMLLRFKQGIFLVAEIDGTLIGYVVATVRGRSGHIISIAVIPEQRRRGIGRRLMEEVVEELRRRGASVIRLEVKKGNPAVDFYLSCGFKRFGIIPSYYGDGSDAISMELTLN
ncbi:MAG: ribosomal protein S18-alanine N-acetyltransferase [Thermoproteota archaeon]